MAGPREPDGGRGPVPAQVDRASAVDLGDLAADQDQMPAQIGAILRFDTGEGAPVLRLATVRRALGQRIPSVPRLRQRLRHLPPGLGRPIWVDDGEFDISAHVRAVRCADAGDEATQLRVAARLLTSRLPQDRPLWAAELVTGRGGAGAALIVVLHHVLADGIGGLAVLAQLVDGMPAVPPVPFPRSAPSALDLLTDAARARMAAVAALPAELTRLPQIVRELGAVAATRSPRTSLDRPTGPRRELAVVRADLAAVRQAAHERGATVNDAILAAVTGALSALLAGRGESAAGFVISVPASERNEASALELGNRVGTLLVPVPAVDDRGLRLERIARITRARKRPARAPSAAILDLSFRGLARLGAYSWLMARQPVVTTMVTNLRGPEIPVRFLGATVTDVIPLRPTAGNVTVAFAALSYAGTLTLTLIADPRACPDLERLAEHLRTELALL